MTPRFVARCGAAVGALGLALLGGPAWAADLPSLPTAPVGPVAPVAAPDPVPTSLLPSPVASALDPILSKLPGHQPTSKPSPRPAPKAQPAPQRQVARSQTRIAVLPAAPANLALRTGNSDVAALRPLSGIVGPMAVPPMPVVPQLAPVPASGVRQAVPAPTGDDGLPAVIVALAIGAVSAAAAGQVAEMAARRRVS